ncbi:hypothetical protein LguiA_025154 [Lonicera macranthoides]
MATYKRFSFPHVYHYIFVLVSINIAKAQAQSLNHSLYSFGDSFVDPGNNNYLDTIAKANSPPYGQDFVNGTPTGRFTNGRQVTDFIALNLSALNYPRAYLDPNLSLEDLMSAVGFGSAGTGFDPLTPPILDVIPISTQLKYFIEYKRRLVAAIGEKNTEDKIGRALVYVTAGTNDFIVNYFSSASSRPDMYTIPEYQSFLLQLIRQFIQGLMDQGVRRIAFSGLPPLGCLPTSITLYSNDSANVDGPRDCVEYLNTVAQDFNLMLQNELMTMQNSLNGSKIAYIDFYGPVNDTIKNPQKYGFDQVNRGCCGSGTIEQGILCSLIPILCPDASKYVFWDATHFTEKAYYIIYEANRPIIDSVINFTEEAYSIFFKANRPITNDVSN